MERRVLPSRGIQRRIGLLWGVFLRVMVAGGVSEGWCVIGGSVLSLVEYWGVAGGGVVADVVGYDGDAGGWWCVEFVEVQGGVGGFELVGASALLEGGADGGWVGGGCGVCGGGHCCGGAGESGEDECPAAAAGVDVGLPGLPGVGLGVLLIFDPFGGAGWWCGELVEEVGLFFGFSGHGGLSGRSKKL